MTNIPFHRRENALVGLLTLAAFTFVTYELQLSPLLTAIAAEFDEPESRVGQLQTVGALSGAITAVLVAPYMHCLPRRTWFRLLLILLITGGLLTVTAQSFAWLVVARIVSGLGSSVLLANCFTAASEIVTDIRRRNRSISLIASGTTLGIMIGLPMVALIEEFAGWRWASAAVILPLCLVLAATHWLPAQRADLHEEQQERRASYRMVLGDRPAAALLLATGFMFVAYIGWLTYFGAYVEHEYGRGAQTLSALFLVGGLAELITNLGIPWLTRRFSGWWICIAGAAIGGLTLLGSGVIFVTVASLFVAIALFHIATAFLYIGSNTLLVASPAAWRGTALALAAACARFGGAAGALIGGAVFSATNSYDTVYHLLGGVLLVTVIVLAIGRRSTRTANVDFVHNAPA